MSTTFDVAGLVRGISANLGVFQVSRIEEAEVPLEEGDSFFYLYLDMQPEVRGHAGLEEIQEEDKERRNDFRVSLAYTKAVEMLSLVITTESGVPKSAYGWALGVLNTLNDCGTGRLSKFSFTEPDIDDGSETEMELVVAWEVGFYARQLFSKEALRALTHLVEGVLARLITEACSTTADFATLYKTSFPSGKLSG